MMDIPHGQNRPQALRQKDALESAFLEFLQGDRTARIFSFLYHNHAESPAGEGATTWDDALDGENPYYIFPNEAELIARAAHEISRAVNCKGALIELGVGSGKAVRSKTLPLVRAIRPQRLVVNDLSRRAVEEAQGIARQAFPGLQVIACPSDFLDGDSAIFDHVGANVAMLGSSISNLPFYDGGMPVNALVSFLRGVGGLLGPGGSLIVTQDTNQNEASLKEAYGTPELAQFRQNALHRLVDSLNVEGFDLSALRHEMLWEPRCHLLADTFVSTRTQTVRLNGRTVKVPEGGRLYLANCYKYPARSFSHMAIIAGLEPVGAWMDAQNRVALHVLAERSWRLGI